MRYFPSFKAFGDLVIACHHLRHLDVKDDVLLCANHLRPLLYALNYSRPVKWLDDQLEGVPALFDIRKRGAYAAIQSAWFLRWAVRDATSPGDVVVFDRSGWRQQWVCAGRQIEQIASGEANIYLDYAKYFGLKVPLVESPVMVHNLQRIGIFPDSRVATKQIPEAVVAQMVDALKTLDVEVCVVRAGPHSEINTFEDLVSTVQTMDAVVSADSLPAHLAEYWGLPVFVVTPQPNLYWLPQSAFLKGAYALFPTSVAAVTSWVDPRLSN
ncbi:hypothetical protein KIK84_15630 [Curvibacter sp. CHRR-16]|uniref:hypothetical protein n=1 Tax=Curvibacter sp. CHRR-16 TaxID=2835872 RepID=UPI001BD97ADD|nr:hypothetical protein [Curvibacter sp. CHRR-16]MBT0571753.1 hypothetical protein [Curvibacter sp. CHRR-16]